MYPCNSNIINTYYLCPEHLGSYGSLFGNRHIRCSRGNNRYFIGMAGFKFFYQVTESCARIIL